MTDLATYYEQSYPPSLWAPSPPAVAPVLTSLDPATGDVADEPFTFTVHGSGFTADAVVTANEVYVPCTFVSDTELTVPDWSPIGGPGTYWFGVNNLDGIRSNLLLFEVAGAPVLNQVMPSQGSLADAPLTISAVGSGMTPLSVIEVDGVPLTTTYYDPTFIGATFTPTEVGVLPVVVWNGALASTSRAFTVTA